MDTYRVALCIVTSTFGCFSISATFAAATEVENTMLFSAPTATTDIGRDRRPSSSRVTSIAKRNSFIRSSRRWATHPLPAHDRCTALAWLPNARTESRACMGPVKITLPPA